MSNKLNSKSTLTGKMSQVFMKIGDAHAKELSFITGFYEPKVSLNLLEVNKEQEK
jgi:hypothetical protein